jgi:hypothetical protein
MAEEIGHGGNFQAHVATIIGGEIFFRAAVASLFVCWGSDFLGN